MKSKKLPAGKNEVILPRLHRLRLDSLECKRNGKLSGAKLSASIKRSIRISLINKSEEVKNCRVIIGISVNGNWSPSGEDEPAILFSAIYNVRFNFSEEIDAPTADKLLSDQFYRDALVAQAMPLVNMHMYSQLDAMGIDAHSRSLGMDTSGVVSHQSVAKKSSKAKASDSPSAS